MFRIEIEFPHVGCSRLRVEQDDKKVDVKISWLSDGLGDLIRALNQYIVGGKTAVALLEDEPGETRVVIHACGDQGIWTEMCVVSEDWKVGRDVPIPFKGHYFRASLPQFGKEVVRAVSAMLAGHSLEDYYEGWAGTDAGRDPETVTRRRNAMSFPAREFEEICQKVAAMPDSGLTYEIQWTAFKVVAGPVLVPGNIIARAVECKAAFHGSLKSVEVWRNGKWGRTNEDLPGFTTIADFPSVPTDLLKAEGVPEEPFPAGYDPWSLHPDPEP